MDPHISNVIKTLFLLVPLISALPAASALPESRPYTLTRMIGHKDGLSGDKIQSVVRDSSGTMWIGTTNGLDRIYGNKINSYRQPELLNKVIDFIAMDRQNNIWVSAQHTLLLYDRFSDSFRSMSAGDMEKIRATSWDTVRDGIIFNTYDGIVKYDYSSRELRHILPRPASSTPYNGFKMLDDIRAAVSSSSGEVYILDIYSGEREKIYSFGRYTHVNDICTDGSGRIWIAVYSRGLICISPEDGHVIKAFTNGESFLGEDIVLSLEYGSGKLWITTDGRGVFILDTESFSVTGLEEYAGMEIPKEAECVTVVRKDSSGLWIGTVHHGLINLRPGRISCLSGDDFGSIQDRGANRYTVSCLCEDSHGMIWVGTDGGGLYSYAPGSRKIRPAKNMAGAKIVSIEDIGGEWLMLSIYNKGLYKYSTATGQAVPLTIVSPEINRHILSQDISIALKKHSSDKVYIACRQIYEYDIRTGRIKDAGFNLYGTTSLEVAYDDSLCTILYSHFEIYRINRLNGSMERLMYSSEGDIISVVHTPGKLFMLRSGTLASIDLETSEYKEIPFRYNRMLLPVMATDRTGNLWLATRKNLIRLEGTSPDRYTVFGQSDGYAPSTLSEKVTLLSDRGELYLGGHTGLCIVDTENIRPDTVQKHISLLSVNVDKKNIRYDLDNRTRTPSISIPWNYNSMYFDISVNNGNIFKADMFRYTINGRGKHTEIYSGNRLSLPALSPGEYSIDVAYADRSDNWIDRKDAITVKVTPPWWRSIIFIGSLLILLVGGSMSAVFLYHRREKIKAARVYRQRKEKLAESKLRFLTNISHELRTPLTLIYSPLKRLLEKNEFNEPVKAELTGILSQ